MRCSLAVNRGARENRLFRFIVLLVSRRFEESLAPFFCCFENEIVVQQPDDVAAASLLLGGLHRVPRKLCSRVSEFTTNCDGRQSFMDKNEREARRKYPNAPENCAETKKS